MAAKAVRLHVNCGLRTTAERHTYREVAKRPCVSVTKPGKSQGGHSGNAEPAKAPRKLPTGPGLTDEEIDAIYADPEMDKIMSDMSDEERRKSRREAARESMRKAVHEAALARIEEDLERRIKVDNFKELERIYAARMMLNSS